MTRLQSLLASTLLACVAVPALMGAASPAPTVRPGPDILYAPPAASPQLENAGVWRAAPILVSGASAYRNGEFLYQDYLFDDRGAAQRAVYPPELRGRTADNAADLLEVRLKPLADATAIRISYNSMLDPEIAATTVALGDAAPKAALPFGAGGTLPATVFVTVHGSTAVLTDAATGRTLPQRATASVDRTRRQVEVRVPYAAFDPRGKTVRVAAGAGLWDTAQGRYLTPNDVPGPPPPEPGAAPAPNRRPLPPLNPARSLLFNLAFRSHETLNTTSLLPFYNDVQQADALMSGDLSPFYAMVDFAKLAAGRNDDSGVPTKGFMSRILVSHYEMGQGRSPAVRLGPGCAEPCIPEHPGRLQPYGIYIPTKAPPASGYGLTLDLHSNAASYGRWLGQQRWLEFGERGTGSIVVTPQARGIGAGYFASGAADTFEVWADVARRYKIDPTYVSLAGVSMGTGGAFKFAGQYPDLFAAMALHVNCPNIMMEAHRYVPVMMMTGDIDATTECHPGNPLLDRYTSLGHQLVWWNFLEHPHPFSSRPKSWKPFADFLGMKKRAADPPKVTYILSSDGVEPAWGLNPDHAYWVSGLKMRDLAHKAAPIPRWPENVPLPSYGRVEVFTHGMGVAEAVANPPVKRRGRYDYDVPTYPWPNYDEQVTTWRAPAAIPKANVLDVTAENVAAITIDPRRAKVDCNATINLKSDGPTQVRLLGCPSARVVAAR